MLVQRFLFVFLFLNLVSCKHTKKEIKKQLFVQDNAHLFTKIEIKQLDAIIAKFEKKTSNEIAVITINSIKPHKDIHTFATEYGQRIRIGKKKKNNGLVIAISKSLRKISIATGLGTEKILTNRICKKVIDSTIAPQFKKDNFYLGSKKGIEKLITLWKK